MYTLDTYELKYMLSKPGNFLFMPTNPMSRDYLEDVYLYMFPEASAAFCKMLNSPLGNLVFDQRCPNLIVTRTTRDDIYPQLVEVELLTLALRNKIDTLIVGDHMGTDSLVEKLCAGGFERIAYYPKENFYDV